MAQKLHKHQLTIVQDNRGKVAVNAMQCIADRVYNSKGVAKLLKQRG